MQEEGGPTDLIWLGAGELAQRIRSGQLSAAEVTEAYIERIVAVDRELNAVVIRLFDEARAQAAAADQALRRGEDVGLLHGVPVTIKEQFRVTGTQTTLGASEQVGNVYGDEGPLVTALRDAGAVILGKTNIIQTLAGWESDNPVYGRTNNPWDPDRSPGGSSGGEAAIVAAGGSALGLAGDLGGSIRVPAVFCGVHGYKPTSWRLSNDDFATGLLSSGQEVYIPQPGPIARNVADLMLAMAVLSETSMRPTHDIVPPVPWRDPTGLQVARMRIGVYTDNGYFSVSPSVKRAIDDAADTLRGLGAEVEPVDPPDTHEGVRIFLRAASAGAAIDLVRLLGKEKPIAQVAGMLRGARLPGPLRALAVRAMAARGQRHLARVIEHVRPSSTSEYFEIVEARNDYRARYARTLDDGSFDAVICPPAAIPAFTHGSSEFLLPAVSYSLVYNVLGTPAGVVSISKVRPGEETSRQVGKDRSDITAAEVESGSAGLPLGVQVVARHWDDHTVLAIMSALEDHFRETADYPTLRS